MLNINCFKDIVTYEDLQNFVKIQESRCDEYNLNKEDLFKVSCDEYSNTSYLVSTAFRGKIISHYFEYSEDNRHFGLIRLMPNTDKFIKVSDCIYTQFTVVADGCIFMHRDDNTVDLVSDGKVLVSDIVDVEDIGIQWRLSLLRLRFVDGSISLVCLEHTNSHPQLFMPTDIDMFRDWYYNFIEELGYDGSLDDVPISEIIGVLHEVISSCLVNKRYKVLSNLEYKY